MFIQNLHSNGTFPGKMAMMVVWMVTVTLVMGIGSISPNQPRRIIVPTYLRPTLVIRQIIWNKFFQLNDPQYWNPVQRVPCWQDRILLPDHYAIFLNHQLETSELILPQDGELVVGPNADIRLTSDLPQHDRISCPNSNDGPSTLMEFNPGRHPTSWFEPQHWQPMLIDAESYINTLFTTEIETIHDQLLSVSNYVGQIGSSNPQSSIPDSERIPCRHDLISFPLNGTFKVRIDRSELIPNFMMMTIGERSLRSRQFPEFATSTFYGKLLFDVGGFGNSWNEITKPEPESGVPKTIICGNDSPQIMSLICDYRGQCDRAMLPCSDPIKPVGFCCPICGSSILFGNSDRLKSRFMSLVLLYRARVRKLMQSMFDEEPQLHRYLHIYLHWLRDSRFQLIVTNVAPEYRDLNLWNGDDGQPMDDNLLELDQFGVEHTRQLSDRYVQKISQRLKTDFQTFQNFPMQIESSVDWIDSGFYGFRLFTRMLLALLVLFLIGLVTVPLYHYYRRNRFDPAFTFVRFRSHASDIELELDPNSQLVAAAIAENRLQNLGSDPQQQQQQDPVEYGGSTCDIKLVSTSSGMVPDPARFFLNQRVKVSSSKLAKQFKSIFGPSHSVPSFQSLKSSESCSSIEPSTSNTATVAAVVRPLATVPTIQIKSGNNNNGLTENFDNPIFRMFSEKTEEEESPKKTEEVDNETNHRQQDQNPDPGTESNH